ncbi:MAG TPA: hypothetical protein VM434_09780 [Beijerinckiaceae bacterium]|nr:hypothetical protein [Beijerinckiaceae bacterium]
MTNPKVPTERPDPKAAARDPKAGAQDRPGFDLGGAVDKEPGGGKATIPGAPKGGVGEGNTGEGRAGRAGGASNPRGSRPATGGGSDSGGTI